MHGGGARHATCHAVVARCGHAAAQESALPCGTTLLHTGPLAAGPGGFKGRRLHGPLHSPPCSHDDHELAALHVQVDARRHARQALA